MGLRGRVLCAALLAGGVFLPTAPAEAETVFQVETSATAVHLTITQRPASSLITASLFDDAVAYAAGQLDTGGSSEALAAPVFPGRLVVQGPQLVCSQLFTCPAEPPDYPFLADASFPRRRHDAANVGGQQFGSGPFVTTPLTAIAHARAASNASRSSAGTTSLLVGAPNNLKVGASTAASTLSTKGGRLVVDVDSTVNDIEIGGLLHIDAVRASTHVLLRPGRQPQARPSVTVSGVTVAGQDARIDDHGVHVAGQDGPSLDQQLAEHGISVRTVGAERDRERNAVRVSASALQVQLQLPVSGVPYVPNPLPPFPPPFDQIPQLPGVNANGTYVADVTFGAVGVAAGRGVLPTFDLTGPTTAVGPAPNSGSGAPPDQPAPDGQELVAGLADQPPTAGSPPVTAPAGVVRSFADLLSQHQLELFYAVLALGTIGLFAGWRTAVGVRLRMQR